MSNSWAKVRSFLDMMDIQDLHSPLTSSVSSLSYSTCSNCDLHPLSIGARGWHVGESTARQILSVIQPNADSENRRKEIIEYLQGLIEDTFGIKVFPFGSVPLKTYLPHGDIDLTVVDHSNSGQDLAAEICSLLANEEKNNTSIQVKDVLCVPAQVRVVKCTVGGICVDISFNQTAGLCALYFLEQVDRFIGKEHLFKRSVILIKSWCYYESRLLGGFHGLISTYALETMVLHVINLFHSTLQCPLAVLYKFLEYYSTFDWNRYCVGINGLVLISSLPRLVVQPSLECDDLLLTDAFLRSCKETTLSSMGVVGSRNPAFPVKFLNILDPLRDDNNLGRSVSKGNFYRIRSALSYGAQNLSDILMLPLENMKSGLEKFFKDTLERNGKGRRADAIVPVSAYGSEVSSGNSGYDYLLSGIQYGLWFHDYGMIYPVVPKTSENRSMWNNRLAERGHNVHYDQNLYYSIDQSPPSSYDGVTTSVALSNVASGNAHWISRGTGTFIPHMGQVFQRNAFVEVSEEEHECGKEHESGKGVGTVDSPACTPREENVSCDEGGNIEELNIEAFNLSIEEFPVLPGSKPMAIPIVSQLTGLEPAQVKETSASLDDSLELDSFKHLSPRSVSLSEAGKQSDSDVSVILDSVSDPVSDPATVTVLEDQESSKSEEKLVVVVQPPQLGDDLEFPPLSRPAPPEPVITVNKKEFPPLGTCLKPLKKNKWRKDFK